MNQHPTWPAERFYWALVPDAPWKGSGELPAGLLALAEDDLPVPAETLHAVGVPVEGGVLICAAPKNDLEQLAETTLSLHAEGPPSEVPADCSRLNLLVGAFEPRSLRRARLLRHALGAGTVMVCALVISAGLVRRASAWNDAARMDHDAWTAAAQEAVPGAAGQTVLLDLRREASRMDGAASMVPPADAAMMLTGLLERWPAQVPSKPQAIAVRERVVTVSVLVEDAPAFLAAFTTPSGWTMDQPMLNTSGDLTRLSLTLHAAENGSDLAAGEDAP